MKSIGAYALLIKNSIQRGTWKQYEFDDFFEQTNLTFAVLLFIMEQSLKDEPCTMDDIGGFIDTLNMRWFKKPISYEMCKELGDFIVTVILGNEGKVMYFKGFDFEEGYYKNIHISFVANKIIYLDGQVKRTTYYLTEDGYNLMLSTLELESNMKLTIHEMIFKLHIEKATYDKAVDDIKNIFNILRIQLHKIQDAMQKIKQNALNYSVQDYKILLESNLDTIGDTKKQFTGYRENIRERVKDLEERDINIKKLDKKDSDNLKNLKIIEGYLSRAIDEHQKILSTHFDLKALYTKELEDLSQMTLIKRFNMRSELYDKVLKNPNYIMNIDYFLRPLFNRDMDKTYNINKALEIQKPIRRKQIDEDEEILSFSEEEWQKEQNAKLKEKIRKYKNCISVILSSAYELGGISIDDLKDKLDGNYDELIPTVEIFKEVIIELLKAETVDISVLKKERNEHLSDTNIKSFQLNECILELVDEKFYVEGINNVSTFRLEDSEPVVFENVKSEAGNIKRIFCSNVYIKVE